MYPVGILCATLGLIVHVEQIINLREDDDPAHPAARGIEYRFDRVLDAVEQLRFGFDIFTDMAPDDSEQVVHNDGHEIYQKREIPRDGKVRACPEEPGFNVVLDITSVVIWMWLVPIEVHNQRGRDDEARDNG